MTNGLIRIGTRGSELALWQTQWVKSKLQQIVPHPPIEIVVIKTVGDTNLESPLSAIGDKGLFTKEIECALLEHRIDLAVHSLKDLPTQLPEGLMIGAITDREAVHDVFIAHPEKHFKKFDDVPHGGRIATGSLRRKSQLLNWRPDLELIDLRGNLGTRFAKLDSSDWDGMVLASAGVTRLGLAHRITDVLPMERVLPAVGQGALAIEIRQDDETVLQCIAPLASASTTLAVHAERAFLRYLEGGCQVPIGAYARPEDELLVMDGIIGSLDGGKIFRGSIRGRMNQAESLGRQLAERLADSGGKAILNQIRNMKPEAKLTGREF